MSDDLKQEQEISQIIHKTFKSAKVDINKKPVISMFFIFFCF